MDPFLGQISLRPSGTRVKFWIPCDGRLLPINQNQALYALIGSRFGGDGRTSFALPDLQADSPQEGLAYHIAVQGMVPK